MFFCFRGRYIVKSDRLATLLELTTKTQTDFTPMTKRSLMRVGVNIGLTYPNAGDRLRFWLHLLGPLKDDFLKIMNDENFNKNHSEEPVRMQIASIFESVIGDINISFFVLISLFYLKISFCFFFYLHFRYF